MQLQVRKCHRGKNFSIFSKCVCRNFLFTVVFHLGLLNMVSAFVTVLTPNTAVPVWPAPADAHVPCARVLSRAWHVDVGTHPLATCFPLFLSI